MMTPEQLLTGWANCRDTRKAHDLLKQFQLDAYKAGMTRAAEISIKTYDHVNDNFNMASVTIADNIEYARDSLKEIPNE